MTTHEMARQLLALPDVTLEIQGWCRLDNHQITAEITRHDENTAIIWQKPGPRLPLESLSHHPKTTLMKFTLALDCNSAAFHTDDNINDPYVAIEEIARILREAAMYVEKGSVARQLYDLNGNLCGRLDLKENPEGL